MSIMDAVTLLIFGNILLDRSDCFGQASPCLYGFTTVMWLKLSSIMFTAQDLYIISSGGQTSSTREGIGIAVLVKSSLLFVTVRNGDKRLAWTRNDISAPQDTWFHLGIIWKEESGLVIYINGLEAATDTQPSSYSHSGSAGANGDLMYVGKPNNAYGKFGTFVIDDWYFWNTTLKSEHMMEIYQKYGLG